MNLLTQTEVLKELNSYLTTPITQSSFSKKVKKGQIPFHYKSKSNKKFYKFNEVAEIYNLKIKEIESSTPKNIKNTKKLYTTENLTELRTLLNSANTPMNKVSIIDTFWAGKIKELKYKEANRELIPMYEAQSVIEVGVTNFKTKMYEIPHQLKARFPDASNDLINNLHSMIDNAFDEFSKAKIQ